MEPLPRRRVIPAPNAGHPDDHPVCVDEAPRFPFWRNFASRPLDWIEDWENYPGGERTFVSPSLDLAVQFRRLTDVGEWLLVQGVAPIADRG